MADSNKSTVVIASVLKPVDDSRMYEKIGLTLAASGKYIVHVIGMDSAKSNRPDIVQHGFRPFSRISLTRLTAPWRIFFRTRRLQPDIFMITTHELLLAGVLMKLFTKCKLVYDVQENYYWNILYTRAFPLVLKPFAALFVRGKEQLTSSLVDHFLLAEKGYERELKFPGSRYTVIENRLRLEEAPPARQPLSADKETINLLFSGTIAESTGVFTAIELAIRLHVIDERIRLTIIGHCAQRSVLEKVRLLIHPRPFIQLIADKKPVPHAEIFRHIRSSDFGLVTYQIGPATMNSIPTKLYEYLGFKLPIVLVDHRPWVELCIPYSAAITFSAHNFDAGAIFKQMLARRFYTAEPEIAWWKSEEPRLLAAVEAL